ncbi:Cell division protein FtsZ [Geodia barretti]|uniref:Cell division protein FtsZ n=1 Tax=Geodia barretti TaxID=519541 RepID=A0AA35WZK6_GEOBA|nr:Cell division protein FtsZ [Geodia barretti]
MQHGIHHRRYGRRDRHRSRSVIARTAREADILTVGVVTKPFEFEGNRKMMLAEEGIERLRKEVEHPHHHPQSLLLRVVETEDLDEELLSRRRRAAPEGVQGMCRPDLRAGEINTRLRRRAHGHEGEGDALRGVGVGTARRSERMDAATTPSTIPLLGTCPHRGAVRAFWSTWHRRRSLCP